MRFAVYGTLKSGRGNNRLLSSATLIGRGVTEREYFMYDCGFPFLSKDGLEGQKPVQAQVEVYETEDNEVIRRVDALEGYDPNNHDGSWYKREVINVALEDGSVTEAWVYMMDLSEEDKKRLRYVEDGNFK